MSARRFKPKRLDGDGAAVFVDGDGNELVVRSLTAEFVGGKGGAVPSEEQQRLEGETTPNPSEPDDVERVWATYDVVMKPRHHELDPQSRKIIREALKVATVNECQGAIAGCRSSAFHMGDNDRRRKYNRLSQILKGRPGKETTRERIDFFLDLAAKSGVQSPHTSADPARVSQAKRQVLDGWQFPGDETVVRVAEEAARWLRAHGWIIDFADDGRPSFRHAEA